MATIDNDKLLSKFVGYYQPKNVQDNLMSFEVYSSLKEAEKDFPNEEILVYYNDDIEDMQFADIPQFDKSWDALMQVVDKIEKLGYQVNINTNNITILNNDFIKRAIAYADCYVTEKREAMNEVCIQFVNWFNQQK